MVDGHAPCWAFEKGSYRMETKMSAQTLAKTSDIHEQAELAGSGLPALVYRSCKAFLTQVLVGPVHHINKRRKLLVAQFLTALGESRRREARRIIDRYRHLIDRDEFP